jgi:serine/threonine protein kinase
MTSLDTTLDVVHNPAIMLQGIFCSRLESQKSDSCCGCALTQADKRGFIAKVSDFGLSQLQPESSPCNGTASASEAEGTVTHMAPEMLMRGCGSCASDVYSFGILGRTHLLSFAHSRIALLHCEILHCIVPCPSMACMSGVCKIGPPSLQQRK